MSFFCAVVNSNWTTSTMATARAKPRFSPADIVRYQGQEEYVVVSVTNLLGFNKYNLLNLKNGEKIQASSHELQKIYGEKLMGDEESDEEIEEILAPEQMETKQRFGVLNEQQLDELAKKRTEPGTDKQTKWAIKIFKGEYSRHLFLIHYIYKKCKQTTSSTVVKKLCEKNNLAFKKQRKT